MQSPATPEATLVRFPKQAISTLNLLFKSRERQPEARREPLKEGTRQKSSGEDGTAGVPDKRSSKHFNWSSAQEGLPSASTLRPLARQLGRMRASAQCEEMEREQLNWADKTGLQMLSANLSLEVAMASGRKSIMINPQCCS